MLETTLIKTPDRYPEKLKTLEPNWMPYYTYLTLKYFGVTEMDHDECTRYHLVNNWKERLPSAPSEELQKILRTI